MMWLLEGLVNTLRSLVITCGTDDLKCILRQCNLADWKLVVSLVRHYRKLFDLRLLARQAFPLYGSKPFLALSQSVKA